MKLTLIGDVTVDIDEVIELRDIGLDLTDGYISRPLLRVLANMMQEIIDDWVWSCETINEMRERKLREEHSETVNLNAEWLEEVEAEEIREGWMLASQASDIKIREDGE